MTCGKFYVKIKSNLKLDNEMREYTITATVLDNNGVRVYAESPESLGDAYQRIYFSRDCAQKEVDYLEIDIPEDYESVEYTIMDDDFYGFVHGDKYDLASAKLAGLKIDSDDFDEQGMFIKVITIYFTLMNRVCS